MKTELIFFLPNFNLGGAGSSITKKCIGLTKKFKNTIISLTKCYYANELKKNAIHIVKLNSHKTIFSFKEINKIINNKIKNKNVVFISNINYANALSCMFIKKRNNLKIFLIERTPIKELLIYKNITDFIKKKITYLLVKLFYKNVDKIIGNSLKLSKDLEKVCGKKVETIYPPSIIKIKNRKYNIRKKTIISTITRLTFEKNILTLIKAVQFIKSDSIKLNIVGSGDQKIELAKYIIENKLDKKIKLLGPKKNINKFLDKTDLYINSSYFEGFPNSVVEAINNNIPVIASHSNGGIYDIIKYGKKCALFNPKDYYDLAKKIDYFHNNKLEFIKMSKKNKNNSKKFTLKNSIKKYEALFINAFK